MRPFVKTVLLTTLLAGTLDLTAAYISQFIKTGKFADKMLHYIAGGAIGLGDSMKGGAGIAVLGLFIHFFIAFVFTLVFFLSYPKIKLLHYHPIIVGFLYGVLVGVIMTFVVLPLSALPPAKFNLHNALVAWGILGVALGIPIAYCARSYFNRLNK